MWQKRARTALAVLMLAVAVTVVVAVCARRKRDDRADAPQRRDKNATVEAGRGEFTRTKDGRTIFKLEFDRQLTYADGRNVFRDVVITFPNRNGRTFRVTGREARQVPSPGKELGAVSLDGGVTMTGDDGLSVDTSGASYDETASLVRAPGPVTFSRGRVRGSGVGATYDQARDVLSLLDQAKTTIAPDATGQGGMTITAGTAAFARADRTIRFERAVNVAGTPQSATADIAVAYLAPAEDLLDRIELTGHADVTGAAEGATALRGMRADRIVLDYGADGRLLERATLTGSATVDLAAGDSTRTLSGNAIDAALGPGGQAVTALSATGKVTLTLPAAGNTPARTIESARLRGSGDAAGIRTLAFEGGATFKEGTTRTVTADALDVVLEPGFGAATDARFKGRVVFRDRGVRAEAPDARYDIPRELVHLPSSAGTGRARVDDERVSVDARAIVLTAGSKQLRAKGDVRSVLQPQKADARDRRAPAMLERDKPVNVTAAQLDYDGDAGRATYTGTARLWQDERSVQGDMLVLDDKQGNLLAKGNAVSRLILEEKDSTAPKEPATPKPAAAAKAAKTETIARGDTLTYDNAARKAAYEGRASFSGPQGDVAGEKIELFLDETGRTLERSEAYTNVVARFEGGHRATGVRLTYLADGERYLMTGAPVRILEQRADGCTETTGASLTFVRSTDTISVVGNEGSRSQTKPGSCGELR
jgi:lipopolysaccharide export system protein LptA